MQNSELSTKNTSEERKKIRAKIANTVRRNNIEKRCFNCGRDGKILYNFNDPYKVVFICQECKRDSEVLKEAESHRIDIKQLIKDRVNDLGNVNLLNKQIRWYDIETIKKIIDDYMVSEKTTGQYCKDLNMSRYQFNNVLDIYEKNFSKTIRSDVKKKMNRIQKQLVIENKRKLKSE